MSRHPLYLAAGTALLASLALAGCQRDTDDSTDMTAPPAATAPADDSMAGDTGMPGEMPASDPMAGDPMATDPMAGGDMAGPTALDVTAIELGTEAGADNTIASPQTTFAPDDDIAVSIATDGAASAAEVAAKLVYEDGQTAGEQSETITTTGAETTSVTFSNANPWPAGSYTVEVWVNGSKADSAELTVE